MSNERTTIRQGDQGLEHGDILLEDTCTFGNIHPDKAESEKDMDEDKWRYIHTTRDSLVRVHRRTASKTRHTGISHGPWTMHPGQQTQTQMERER